MLNMAICTKGKIWRPSNNSHAEEPTGSWTLIVPDAREFQSIEMRRPYSQHYRPPRSPVPDNMLPLCLFDKLIRYTDGDLIRSPKLQHMLKVDTVLGSARRQSLSIQSLPAELQVNIWRRLDKFDLLKLALTSQSLFD